MKVLITGGTGLIGRALTQALLARGDEVVVFTRFPEKRRSNFPPEVTLAPWRPDPQHLRPWLEEADAVVNLVGANIGERRWTAKRKEELYRSRVEALGTRRVILRTGIVLSTRGGALPRLLLPIRLGVGGPLGSGRFYMPWIHIQDQVRAMLFLLDREDTRGPYNLCAPEPVTNAELVRTLGRLLRRPTWFRVPTWVLRLVLGEMAIALLASIRAVPKRLQEAGFAFQFPYLEDALRDLLAR